MTQRKQKPKVGVVLEPADYEELQRQTPAGVLPTTWARVLLLRQLYPVCDSGDGIDRTAYDYETE